MKKYFFLLIISALAGNSYSQVITCQPLFPSVNDAVTIYFDATQGNGALANYSGDIYIHTGVITNLSTGPSDWKHVHTTWGVDDPSAKMTSLGNHLYSFYIPNINNYYIPDNGEIIEKLAMVFRNVDGSIVGRNFDGSDIFYDVWDGTSLESKILKPDVSPAFVNLNEQVNSILVTSKPSTISIYQNNNYVTQFVNSDSINYTFTASNYGTTWIKYIADDGDTTVADSFYFVVNPAVTVADLPPGSDAGINYINDSTVTLVLVAPFKQYVYAIGDFSNWQVNDSTYMHQTPDGKDWWITLNHLIPQQEYRYQFLVDGNLFIADPYSDKILDPYNDPYITSSTYPNLTPYPTGKASGEVSVFEPGQTSYSWQDAGYVKPDETKMIIYELLIRDFVGAHDYQTLIDTINYLKNLGVNAIELMPISEFEGNISWGYNPNFYFAPDKYYGPKDELKAFIDLCHQNGIAVIQDIVLNHSCGSSPMCQLYWDPVNNIPAANNPWFNQYAPHPYSVCNDFNHESDYTHKFVDDVLKYWVTQYHMDGFRFDLSKGFTQFYSGSDVNLWGQYDQSRINNLERIANQIWSVDPTTYLILEHFADNSEEQVLSDYGFMLWSNSSCNYEQTAMGYASGPCNADISWVDYHSHGFSQPHAVGYAESHDEERVMYKVFTYGNHNGSYDVRPLDSAVNRIKLNACFFFPVPGPKMIYEFGELGYDYTINRCQDGTISTNCRTDPKPIRWDYFQNAQRNQLYKFYSALINLKKNYSVFNTGTLSWEVSGLYKSMRITDANLKVCVLGNFDIVSGNVTPNFPNSGKWYEYFTGDSIVVSNTSAAINLKPGEYRFYTNMKLQQPDLGNVGISDVHCSNELQLQCYPNPAGDNFTLNFYLPEGGNAKLELLDLSGRPLKTISDKNFGSGWFTVDVSTSDLESGMYLCRLSSGRMQQIARVEIEK